MIRCFAMTTLAAITFVFTCLQLQLAGGFATQGPSLLQISPSLLKNFNYVQLQPNKHYNTINFQPHRSQRREVALYSAPDGMHWFVKTEQFCKPFPEVKPHLEAHREWVRSLREEDAKKGTQQTIVSGYRVDENDRPGGGGLMIFAAKDYAAAEEFVRNDPLIANECVDWQLNKWIAETGDIKIE